MDVIRPGADSCVVSVEAMASHALKEFLRESAVECEDTIIIKRQQLDNNRKKLFINDQIVTQKLLEQVSGYIFEIHGQNTHNSLLDPASHIRIIDSYGNLESERDELAAEFKLWQSLKRVLEEIETQRHLIDREIDYLEFVTKELSELAAKVGEEGELAEARSQMQSQERSTQVINDVLSNITEPDLQTQIATAQKTIYKQVKDDSFADILHSLDQASIYVAEAVSALESKLNASEYGNLDAIEERLFAIRAMARKHNVVADELSVLLAESSAKLKSFTGKVEQQSNIANDMKKAEGEYHGLARSLSDKRKKAALALEDRVSQELAPLKMAGSILKVEFADRDLSNAASNGLDEVRFIASNNPGTPLAPIHKIASGGELSRFMLAMKVALFDKFTKPTIIFDEVDTGIGGVVAVAVGERMKLLSDVAQVITITHQPQVAGKADKHILVSKVQGKGSTLSHARLLSEEERLEEIARMISGAEITQVSREAAKELIRNI